MRLFVAIVPPPPVLAELADAVAPLQAARPELRWTGPADWHLTLAFLGEVSDGVLPELGERLARAAARHQGRHVAVQGGGAFPRPARATVLWAGIHADEDLGPVAASVAAAARRAGAPPPDEGRKYRPHLTLARSRQPADLGQLTAALADFAGQPWAAAEIRLIRSNLAAARIGAHGERYEDLGDWQLGPGRAG